ncbi:MAG: hypothetical protein Aurels2KO_30810 [Aureliella sp.]
MPIKFTCPTCSAAMTVKDEMAGKRGKCKCGAQITVPKPKAAQPSPPPQAPSGLDDALGDLTESDFATSSPYEKVYSDGPVVSNDKAALKRFEKEAAAGKKFKKGKLSAVMIVVAILELIQALGWISGGAALGFLPAEALDKMAAQVPWFGLGIAVAIPVCILLGLLAAGGGVGFLRLKPWGWLLTATVFMFTLSERVVALIVVLMNGFEQIPFFIGMFGFVFTFGFVSVIYNSDLQENYKIKNMVPPVLAAVIGIGLSAGLNSVALLKGDSKPPAAEQSIDGGEY